MQSRKSGSHLEPGFRQRIPAADPLRDLVVRDSPASKIPQPAGSQDAGGTTSLEDLGLRARSAAGQPQLTTGEASESLALSYMYIRMQLWLAPPGARGAECDSANLLRSLLLSSAMPPQEEETSQSCLELSRQRRIWSSAGSGGLLASWQHPGLLYFR